MFVRHTLLRTAFANALVLVGLTTTAYAAEPVDIDAQWHGVFAEPLITKPAPPSDEKLALMKAVTAYRQAYDAGNTIALEQFLAAHPNSPWRASLWLDMGLANRATGRFSAAIHAFEHAREGAQTSPDANL